MIVARTAAIALLLLACACGGDHSDAPVDGTKAVSETDTATNSIDVSIVGVDDIAERFVKLSLGIGLHDESFVDAYHGPAAWRSEVEAAAPELEALEREARDLIEALAVLRRETSDDARQSMLAKNLTAALTRIQMARGESFSFDEETQLLYDATAPVYDVSKFDAALAGLEGLLPGEEALSERVDAFRASLAIPEEKLEAVFKAAIAECRKRTLAHFDLAETERFTLEFVNDKPWSGYNWYQGDYNSLIEVNTDLPIIIDRAVDLGCHEGYPGHHTWNIFMQRNLLEEKGWIEYSVYPLFSPQSLIAEGSANYGIELAFPGDEKIAFERDVLFPLAGLDPDKADMLNMLNKSTRTLSHARNHIARAYLDGDIDHEQAIVMTMKYSLVSRKRAEQSIRFIETYRGYVINYNLGLDLVRAHLDRKMAAGEDPWEAFKAILEVPTSASDIAN